MKKNLSFFVFVLAVTLAFVSCVKKSVGWLFPLQDIVLGETTEADLARLGEKEAYGYATGYTVHVGGKEWECLLSDDGVCNGMEVLYANGETSSDWPDEWKRIGYDPRFSYNDWLSFLMAQGYAVSEAKSYIEDDGCFGAWIEATRNEPVNHSIVLSFSKKDASVQTKDSLVSFHVFLQ